MEAAYRGGGPWLNAVMEYIQGNLTLVRERLSTLPGVKLTEPEGTFLMWLDFGGLGLSDDELFSFLRNKAKWAVTRGSAFGEEGIGFVRLNIACTHSQLEKALDQLEAAIAHRV